MTVDFGLIERVSLRDIWSNEASDFTPWLADNVEALGEALGFDLELVGREASVGSFSLDLLAKDLGSQKNVIIENQLTATDHDHLGKLITYASGFDASVVIWLAESIRDEHRQALEWLNQRTDTDTQFFAVVVEVLKIDGSKPAFQFKLIVTPNEWQKSKRRSLSTATPSSRNEEYGRYFQALVDKLRIDHQFTKAEKPSSPESRYEFSSCVPGVFYTVSLDSRNNTTRIYLYINQDTKKANKALFDALKEKDSYIHSLYGLPLEWRRKDGGKACYVELKRNLGMALLDMREEEKEELRRRHIDYLLKMKEVFGPLMKEIVER